MELDCQRHNGYAIWLGESIGIGWSYVVTPTSAHIRAPGARPDANTIGGRSGRRPSRGRTQEPGFVSATSKSLRNAAENAWSCLTPHEGGPHDTMFVWI
jgi:hypothetical protein